MRESAQVVERPRWDDRPERVLDALPEAVICLDSTGVVTAAWGACAEIFGDTIERTVTWKGGGDVGMLAGRPVRMLVELRDADLYSFKFE